MRLDITAIDTSATRTVYWPYGSAYGPATDPAAYRVDLAESRLEIIGESQGGLVVVDYAHKPEALMAALQGVRPFVTGKLICVFGCGGDRDRGKREIMGRIAQQQADVVMVTDDNPRSEEPSAIRAEILKGCPEAIEIGDRREAILSAVGMAGEGDVVLIAGKGHETGQIVGDKVLPTARYSLRNTNCTYPISAACASNTPGVRLLTKSLKERPA